jgi:DHA2 family methylenomycin A resistance protein-like MFS transporter
MPRSQVLVRDVSATPTLIVASAAFFMVVLDVTIVNVALPTFERQLGASLQALQWIVDGYTLMFAAFLLTGGALGDGFGARGTYAGGIALFSLASLACGLAPSSALLIAARVVQGVGAALVVPGSLALIRHAYDDPRRRAGAIATWTGAGGAAMAGGPVLGGLLVDTLGWRSIFLVNVAVGLAALWIVATRVPPTPLERRRLDVRGQVLAVAAVGGLTFAVIEGPALGWGAPAVLAAIAAALVGGAAFVSTERRAPDPMLPLELARRPHVAGGALVGALLNLAFYGLVFVLSLYFQQVRGDSALETGLAFLPMTALITAANLASPRIAARVGALATIVAGELVLAGGVAATLALDADSSNLAIGLALLPIGVGGGLSVPPLTTVTLDAAPPALAGIAAGAFNATRQVGGAVGVAVFGALLSAHAGASFMDGMRLSLLAALAAALGAVVLSVTLVRRA